MEAEITTIPPLQPGELSLIEHHSFLNILNVLQGELIILGLHLSSNHELLSASFEMCNRAIASLSNPERTRQFAALVKVEEDIVFEEIAVALDNHRERALDQQTRDSIENIQSVFHILEVRASEILARTQSPQHWDEITIDELRTELYDVFAAFEKNSKGRFRILYNPAQQQANDYYVDFVAECSNHHSLSLPPAFRDVVRDLAANARKYTSPGGTINIGLYETTDELRCVVQDTGRGIPAEEIEQVVHYGRRGSNVHEVRTMGGGFGLTKAFLVTKRFGGRFWIKSELGVGTRITIAIPRSTD